MPKHRFALLALVCVIAVGCDQPMPTDPEFRGRVEAYPTLTAEEVDVAAALRAAADRGVSGAAAAARALTDELRAAGLLIEQGRAGEARAKVPRLRILIGRLADGGDAAELEAIRRVVGALETLNAPK